MTRRAADQHAVVNRWHSVADDLAGAIERALDEQVDRDRLEDALRRYEEARQA
jgi:benzoyl-CoA reductase/2-hydroxyglutaryl-CoA dehydratase subunit BcrC/BadD/HgdB